MVDVLKGFYPEFDDIKVNIQGSTQVNLFDALVVAGYAVTHLSYQIPDFDIYFVNPDQLTDTVKNKIQEFYYRECGQVDEISYDYLTDEGNIDKGISVYSYTQFLKGAKQEIDKDRQENYDRCKEFTKNFAHTFVEYCWNSTVHKVA